MSFRLLVHYFLCDDLKSCEVLTMLKDTPPPFTVINTVDKFDILH